MELNPSQKEAVASIEGPLLIFAGAGSGKTRVITNRICHMILDRGISASHIVALSFTNKSAKEMESRLRKMVPSQKLKGIILSTFHSLGLKILKEYIDVLGYKKPFLLLNQNDQELLVNQLLKDHKIDPKKIQPKEVLRRLSYMKNTGNQDRFFTGPSDEIGLIAEDLFQPYQDYLKETNQVDFDDLILLPSKILEQKEIQNHYTSKYHYFMVDEFQDTNPIQYDFLMKFMGHHKNLCVVGDDDQSIYAFRGSNRELILNFEQSFPGAKVTRLLENYRSQKIIIQAANSLIQNNKNRREKVLYSNIPSESKIQYHEVQDEKDEAKEVVSRIQDFIIKNVTKGSEIAILFRTNFQSRPFEEELRLRNIPFKVLGGYGFFDRKEIRDCISYLRVIANSSDENSLLRIINYPKRGIGAGTISILQKESMEKSLPLWEILHRILESPDYLTEIKSKIRSEILNFVELIESQKKKFFSQKKLAPILREMITAIGFEKEISTEEDEEKVVKARIYHLQELVNMLAYFEEEEREESPDLFDFLARLALLMEDTEKQEEKEERKVQLLTLHQSKGLEYDIVFIVGLEEGILPSSRTGEDAESLEEERRLLYVGLTRARKYLYLTSAKERKKFGETIPCSQSRFLSELDPECVEVFSDGVYSEMEESDFLKEIGKLKL
jgi:DNA helicase-2/ATP-dependent DNA helicase PcrA